MLNAPSNITPEERLFYFGVAVRSGNIIDYLESQREIGKYKRNLVILDGLDTIIRGCSQVILGEKAENFKSDEIGTQALYLKLLIGDWKILANTPESERIFTEKKEELTNAKTVLENIVNGKEVSQESVDKGIKFFGYLAERCLQCYS